MSIQNHVLFISDLDGTLLQPDATLSKEDANLLNALTARGIQITYATARTFASVRHILSELVFRENAPPIALMNGVLIRDMVKGIYLDRASFSGQTAQEVLDAMYLSGVSPFIYALSADGSLTTCYRDIPNRMMREFMDFRVIRYQKPFREIRHISDIRDEIIYFCLVAPEEDVRRAEKAIANIPGIKYTSYRDHYEKETFYLEIFDERASKQHAVSYLRQYTGADTVICFGDNLNDLPMFEASDIRVAVEQAHPELKAKADRIADRGVPAFIREYCKITDL